MAGYVFSLHRVNDTQTPGLIQLFSIVCKLLAMFMRTFYIFGSYFYAMLIQFGKRNQSSPALIFPHW